MYSNGYSKTGRYLFSTITNGITRLQAKFKSLLAARLVKLTLNTDSSRLNVIASLSPEGQNNQLIAEVFPIRGITEDEQKNRPIPNLTDSRHLPVGTPIQFQLTNNESSDLHVNILFIDQNGEITAIFPNNWAQSAAFVQVKAGRTIQIPQLDDPFQIVLQEPKGVVEVLIIASRDPLTKSLKTLQQIASRNGVERGTITISEPLEVINDLLEDFDAGSRDAYKGSVALRPRQVDTTKLAAMSMSFEIV
ncbi:DUF4384 domain-containing protein [Gloeothece verrucosa]|uniref:DUF4384 domain-containing protein n=1 Tax=Gloeothece verrucosa TaxID=2546359 RepID=UPI00017E26CD|nr:DUF4384 domain-containing protein [Gloeothece verrucosa]